MQNIALLVLSCLISETKILASLFMSWGTDGELLHSDQESITGQELFLGYIAE